MPGSHDAILIVSFGGPERREDVLPFLENVLRGKNVPRERMLEVAEHYYRFEGVSPLNAQLRTLIAAVEKELRLHGHALPIYWGNRNWHPMLADTLRQMGHDGVRRALGFFTSAYSSYSGCRQYLEDLARAREVVGCAAPQVEKLRAFFNHPGFIEPLVESLEQALGKIDARNREDALVVFTAHSIPQAMAENCRYQAQLEETCRLVCELSGRSAWRLVYQSRSGPPRQPWLEPDVCDFLTEQHAAGLRDVVVMPIGFLSDHLEVKYDLDIEAAALCERLGVNMVRAATVGTHPRFITMIRELIEERMTSGAERPALGTMSPSHDVCAEDCCRFEPARRPS